MSNSPRWLLTAYSVLRLGGVLVPLDARAEPRDQASLLSHAGAEVLFVEGWVWRRLQEYHDWPLLKRVVISRPLQPLKGGHAIQSVEWGCFLSTTSPKSEPSPPAARQRDNPATIVYSSGTGGRPKGCVLSHGNYLSQMQTLGNAFPMEEDDVYLSILPSNHAIDFMCGFLIPLLCGARVVHLRTLRPEWILSTCEAQAVTHMAVVPAILEAFEKKLRERLEGLAPLSAAGLRGAKKLNRWLTRRGPKHRVSRLLFAPIHKAFGGRLRLIFAGGAFVPRSTARFFYELGLPVVIGYGLTEACAVISVNTLKPFRDDTVGPPLVDSELRLAQPNEEGRGEVLVRGPQVFQGYLDDPELSAQVLRDGWLHTGDLGEIDATGHLRLVGRIKDMIVTSGGKNVYPEDVEEEFQGVDAEEFAVLAAHRIWSSSPGEDESLVLAVRPNQGAEPGVLLKQIAQRNLRLPAHKRLEGALFVSQSFPRTTSLKLKRGQLAATLESCKRDELHRL